RSVTGELECAPYRSYYFARGLATKRTQQSCIADLKSAGRYVAKDLFEAGGAQLLARPKGAVIHPSGSAETSTYADI
ncbi:MAG: hypothetical protein J2P54_10180, partial [Bradyrhizobiaceae bacterium]|nr:hypothetical protein [Bradyrhizobiaceae bacterium]